MFDLLSKIGMIGSHEMLKDKKNLKICSLYDMKQNNVLINMKTIAPYLAIKIYVY